MKKLERLLHILNLLDRGERVNASKLAQDLEVSERTIYRYLQALTNAGFPIYFDRKTKSHVFNKGYSLKKSFLTSEELFALQAGRVLLRKSFGKGIDKLYDSILNKCQQAKLESKTEKFLVIQDVNGSKDLLPILNELREAIMEYEIVEIEYHKEGESRAKRREIEPRVLFFSQGFWYVHSRDRQKLSPRTFALDRIKAVHRTGRHFLPANEPDFDPNNIEEAFGPYPDTELTKVVVRIDPKVKNYFVRKKWVRYQEVKDLENGETEITFHVRGIQLFKKWLYSWIPFVKIIHPQELVNEAIEDLKKALDAYKF